MSSYLVALVVTAAAVLLRWLLDPVLGNDLPLVTLYGAVAMAVWCGGYRPALLAAALGYLACDYLFLERRGSFDFHVARNLVGLAVYLITCSIIIGFGEVMRIAVRRATKQAAAMEALSLYLLAGDREPGAEVYSAAVDRDQASIVYNEAANMVEFSPALSSRLSVVRSTKRITFQRTRSFYKALSADVPAKEGLNAHAVLVDELHAQKNRELWDTLRYAGASRRQR